MCMAMLLGLGRQASGSHGSECLITFITCQAGEGFLSCSAPQGLGMATLGRKRGSMSDSDLLLLWGLRLGYAAGNATRGPDLAEHLGTPPRLPGGCQRMAPDPPTAAQIPPTPRSQDGVRSLPASGRRPGACGGMQAGRPMWPGPPLSAARLLRGIARPPLAVAAVGYGEKPQGEQGEVEGAVGGGAGQLFSPGSGRPGQRRASPGLHRGRGRPRLASLPGQRLICGRRRCLGLPSSAAGCGARGWGEWGGGGGCHCRPGASAWGAAALRRREGEPRYHRRLPALWALRRPFSTVLPLPPHWVPENES